MKKKPKSRFKEVIDDLKDFWYSIQERWEWVKANRQMIIRKAIRYGLIVLPVLLVAWQLTYSSDRMPLFMRVDGLMVGGQEKHKVVKRLDDAYEDKRIDIYLVDSEKPFSSPEISDLGLTTGNHRRIMDVTYPWYLRIVPTSAFWVVFMTDVDMAEYKVDESAVREYVVKKFGEDCRVEPVNPSAWVSEGKIQTETGSKGGICQTDKVISKLAHARPILDEPAEIKLEAEPIEPTISMKDLSDLIDKIDKKLEKDVEVAVADKKEVLRPDMVRGWLEFNTEGDEIEVSLSAEKASDVLSERMDEKLYKPAGVTKITTLDFTEVSREEGVRGQALDIEATLGSIRDYLIGEGEAAEAVTKELSPRVEYTRTYSKSHTGLSALLKNYSEDKRGVYGVSLIELSGERRSAGYNEDQKFTTASTYKVFVAYSVIRRVESGEYKWSNPVGVSRNLSNCFDVMLAQSDNPCAEELVKKIGYTPLNNDVVGLGLTGTSFIDRESFKTTANDLSRFMAMLESGQLPISDKNQQLFIKTLKRNVYRQGIPAGATGEVANKVGFLDKYLHDTAIVYSPKGTYVLTILTSDSSWGNIAELTKQVESLM